MGFENFGTVSFTSAAKTADFMTQLEAGKVMATKCRKCGTSCFPPKADCPACLSSDVDWFEIEGKGRLNTYTIVNYGPTGFENDAPYILALGEFEGGLQVLARLSRDIKPEDIKVGMSLELSAVKLPDNRVAYEFNKA
jgi:uncharacterized OB-fold protein